MRRRRFHRLIDAADELPDLIRGAARELHPAPVAETAQIVSLPQGIRHQGKFMRDVGRDAARFEIVNERLGLGEEALRRLAIQPVRQRLP